MRFVIFIVAGLLCQFSLSASVDETWVRGNYTKTEHRVPMRDGVSLYTAVYTPNDTLPHPILMFRSTYGSGPYGEEFNKNLWNGLARYTERGYIIVYQDVRGQRMSEGEFENVRPVHILNEKGANDVTDVYDTADWLLANTRSNGNIGVSGNSYLGFTAFTAALSAHPAIKAVCPEAPIGDWFMGDDFHHNGVLMPSHGFGFLSGFGLPRHGLSTRGGRKAKYYADDEYSFFLRNRSIPRLTALLGDTIAFWPDMMEHVDYDKFWTDRNPLNHMGKVGPAVMVVGGLYDAEDLYGALSTYKRVTSESPSTESYFMFGPWSHGGWGGEGSRLGYLRFGGNTADRYRERQLGFFEYYLRGVGDKPSDKVTAFSSGDNRWHVFDHWPPENISERSLYLESDGALSMTKPAVGKSVSTYRSDPSTPVPHTHTIATSTGGGYMYEDQRFASQRPDVLTFVTAPLDSAVTLAGPVVSQIWMSSTTTDADIVVKLIDVYPEEFAYPAELKPDKYPMGGYQQLVRGDIMAAHFREGFDKRVPLVPGKPAMIEMTMPDVCHTFLPGHRIMVQIQSSWFPLFRMSPQQFVNDYTAPDSAFIPADISIYHSSTYPSRLILPVLP